MSALIKTSSLNVLLTALSCPFYKGLKRVKEETEKADLKLSIKKSKIMAFGPISSRQIEEGKVEAVNDFI